MYFGRSVLTAGLNSYWEIKYLHFNSWHSLLQAEPCLFSFLFFPCHPSCNTIGAQNLKWLDTLSEDQAGSHINKLMKTELINNQTGTLAPDCLPVLPKRCLCRDWICEHVLREGPRPGLSWLCLACTVLRYLHRFCCFLSRLGLVDLLIADSSHLTYKTKNSVRRTGEWAGKSAVQKSGCQFFNLSFLDQFN